MTEESGKVQSNSDSKLLQKDIELLSKRIDHAVEVFEGKYIKRTEVINYGILIGVPLLLAAGAIGINFWDANKIREEFQKKYDNYAAKLKEEYDAEVQITAEKQKSVFDRNIQILNEKSGNAANDANLKFSKKLEETQKIFDDQLQKTNEKYDVELQNKQKQLSQDFEKTFNSMAIKQFNEVLVAKFGKNYKKAIDRILDAAENFSVDSGLATCDDKGIEKKKDGDNNEIYSKYITFSHKFSRDPFVLVSVNGLVTTTRDDRLGLWAKADDSSISKAGFQLIVKTSFKNSTSECKIHWLAIDQFSKEK
jgi:hypothetical protein